MSARPAVFVRRGQWHADLRGQGAGQVALGLPPTAPESEAIHAAYARLAALRAAAPGELGPLFDRPRTVAQAAREYAAAAPPAPTPGGANCRAQYLRWAERDLGDVLTARFSGPGSSAFVSALVVRWKAECAPRTVRNRIWIVRAILRHEVSEGRLSGMCAWPRVRLESAPVYEWLPETEFRAALAQLYIGQTLGQVQVLAARAGEDLAAWIARRKVYLSVAYYTGLHRADVDGFLGADVYCRPGTHWRRRNTKSSRVVPDAQVRMPEALRDDLRELLRVTKRLQFEPGEGLTGGPWLNSGRVFAAAAKRAGVPSANLRVFRRSCAYELALRSWSEREVSEYLGHVDQRMIREVYARWPLGDLVSPVREQWTHESTAALAVRRASSVEVSAGTVLSFGSGPVTPMSQNNARRKG